jgi:dethiobiotin synthetase
VSPRLAEHIVAEYFVTGTDTGVGKTTVAAGILAALRRRGVSVAALKPAESGCPSVDGELQPEDGVLLRSAAGLDDLSLDVVVPHRLVQPVAPAIAARMDSVSFDWGRVLAARVRLFERRPALLLVEGAGGLLVPYDDNLLAADLAARLCAPLLIVARASLGTINHTLLTIFEARRRGLAVAGVILNRVVAEAGPDEPTNAAEIERLGDVRVLGTVPHLALAHRRDPDALADAVESAFDPSTLCRVTSV